MIRLPIVVASALLLWLEAPPWSLSGLQWFGLVPMMLVLNADRNRQNIWMGLLFGTVSIGAIYSWLVDTITLFSNIPLPVALLILLLFAIVFGSPYAVLWGLVHPLRRRLGTGWVFVWPAVWVLIEFAMAKVFLFPFTHGSAQYRVPLVFQVVGLTGVWGLSYLIFLCNAVLGEVVLRRREGSTGLPVRSIGVLVAALVGVLGYGSWRFGMVEAGLKDARVVRMAQFQSSLDMVEREKVGAQAAYQEWLDWMTAVEPGSVDLVVLPEGASPFILNDYNGRRNRFRHRISKVAREGKFHLLVGAAAARDIDGRRRFFNTVFAFGPDGEGLGAYDKMVPLPFGEYLPFGDYLPGLAEMIGGIGDFKAGEVATLLPVDGLRVAPPICYEAILSGTCRSFERPDLFVNVTNDAWFGDTAETHQHGMLAATRATELGVPFVRSTYSGTSFIVEPHGVIYAETGVFEEVQRVVPVRVRAFPTLYAAFGDWFVWCCAFGVAGAGFYTRRRQSVTTDASMENPT